MVVSSELRCAGRPLCDEFERRHRAHRISRLRLSAGTRGELDVRRSRFWLHVVLGLRRGRIHDVPGLLLAAGGRPKRQRRSRSPNDDDAAACRHRRTVASLGHRRRSAGLTSDDSCAADRIARPRRSPRVSGRDRGVVRNKEPAREQTPSRCRAVTMRVDALGRTSAVSPGHPCPGEFVSSTGVRRNRYRL